MSALHSGQVAASAATLVVALPGALEAIRECRSAGIVPVMITGDHPATAHAIATKIGIAADDNWHHLATGWGAWYLVELVGFVALPCFLFAVGVRDKSLKLIRYTAAWTVLGIVVNRLNISVVAFNYHLPPADRYVPHLFEICISVFIVTVGILAYRFIVNNMPVLYEHPDYKDAH